MEIRIDFIFPSTSPHLSATRSLIHWRVQNVVLVVGSRYSFFIFSMAIIAVGAHEHDLNASFVWERWEKNWTQEKWTQMKNLNVWKMVIYVSKE